MTGQPASSWFALTQLQLKAFVEVADEIAAARKRAMKGR